MSDASEVRTQLRGPGDNGWTELAPQPDNQGNRWSAFLKKNSTAATVVHALATLVWEATLRLDPIGAEKAKTRGKETNLGLSAIAAGVSLENAEALKRIEAKLNGL